MPLTFMINNFYDKLKYLLLIDNNNWQLQSISIAEEIVLTLC